MTLLIGTTSYIFSRNFPKKKAQDFFKKTIGRFLNFQLIIIIIIIIIIFNNNIN